MVRGCSKLGVVSGVLAFVLCLTAGLWILVNVGLEVHKEEAVWTGIGLYFVGKGTHSEWRRLFLGLLPIDDGGFTGRSHCSIA